MFKLVLTQPNKFLIYNRIKMRHQILGIILILAITCCKIKAENKLTNNQLETVNSRALVSLQEIAKDIKINLVEMWTVLWRKEKNMVQRGIELYKF